MGPRRLFHALYLDEPLFQPRVHLHDDGESLRIARLLGSAQQLTGEWWLRLDPRFWVGIKKTVQTKKPPPVEERSFVAVVIPITRPSAPDLDAMQEEYP